MSWNDTWPLLITQLTIATALYFYFHSIEWLSVGMFKNTLPLIVVVCFTSFQFTLDDFSKYIILWEMHFSWRKKCFHPKHIVSSRYMYSFRAKMHFLQRNA